MQPRREHGRGSGVSRFTIFITINNKKMNDFRSPLSPNRRYFLDKLVESRKEFSPGQPLELTDFIKINSQIQILNKEYIDILEDKIIRSLSDDFPAPSDPSNRFVFSFRYRIDVKHIAEQLAMNTNIPFPILHIASNQSKTAYETEIELFVY